MHPTRSPALTSLSRKRPLLESLDHPNLSFRGSAHPAPCLTSEPGARPRNLLSVSSWPAAAPPNGPCLAVSPPMHWRGLPRRASRDPRVDSSALRPAVHSSGPSAAGPRNDSPRFNQQGHSTPLTQELTQPICHSEGAHTRTFPDHGTRRATEASTVRLLVARRDTPEPALSGCFAAEAIARAAASGLTRSESRFLGPATCGAFLRSQCGRASE
jgi:hypothetical protein